MPLPLRSIFDFVIPRCCAVCGQRLAWSEEVLCTACNWQLPRTTPETNKTDNRLARLLTGQIPLCQAMAWLSYNKNNATARLLLKAKYQGDKQLCQWLGQRAAHELQQQHLFDNIDLIVPVPLTRQRQHHRGYNQCYEMARGVARATNIHVEDNALTRTRFDHSQGNMNRQERQHNVANAFRLIHPERLRGKHILLLDDVATTGATLASCARQIAQVTNTRISVMTIAVAEQ